MTAFRRHLVLLLTLLTTPFLVGVTAVPAHAASYSALLTTAIDDLTTASEVRTGYDRDLFPHWVDAEATGAAPATRSSSPRPTTPRRCPGPAR